MLGGERVVVLRRLPAVDHEVAARGLDVSEELRADVAAAGAKELGPVAVGAVCALELLGVTDFVGEDKGDHPAIPISPSR